MDKKEKSKIILDTLIYIRKIFLKDKEENFKYERTLTTIDCWIEDLDISLEEE